MYIYTGTTTATTIIYHHNEDNIVIICNHPSSMIHNRSKLTPWPLPRHALLHSQRPHQRSLSKPHERYSNIARGKSTGQLSKSKYKTYRDPGIYLCKIQMAGFSNCQILIHFSNNPKTTFQVAWGACLFSFFFRNSVHQQICHLCQGRSTPYIWDGHPNLLWESLYLVYKPLLLGWWPFPMEIIGVV